MFHDFISDFINGRAKSVSTCGTDKSVKGKIRSNVRRHMETFNTEDYLIDPFIRWTYKVEHLLSHKNLLPDRHYAYFLHWLGKFPIWWVQLPSLKFGHRSKLEVCWGNEHSKLILIIHRKQMKVLWLVYFACIAFTS